VKKPSQTCGRFYPKDELQNDASGKPFAFNRFLGNKSHRQKRDPDKRETDTMRFGPLKGRSSERGGRPHRPMAWRYWPADHRNHGRGLRDDPWPAGPGLARTIKFLVRLLCVRDQTRASTPLTRDGLRSGGGKRAGGGRCRRIRGPEGARALPVAARNTYFRDRFGRPRWPNG